MWQGTSAQEGCFLLIASHTTRRQALLKSLLMFPFCKKVKYFGSVFLIFQIKVYWINICFALCYILIHLKPTVRVFLSFANSVILSHRTTVLFSTDYWVCTVSACADKFRMTCIVVKLLHSLNEINHVNWYMVRSPKRAILLLSVHPLINQPLLHLTWLMFPLNHRG